MSTFRIVPFVLLFTAGTSFAATIHGRALYAEKVRPRTLVALDYEDGRHFETTTNEDGEFEFRDVPDGPVDLSAEGDASVDRRGICIREGENSWEVLLDDPFFSPCDVWRTEPFSELRITGRVVDEGGRPLSGAMVKPILTDGSMPDTQFTDDEGDVVLRFEYGDEYQTVRIRIERHGYDMRVIFSPCDPLHFVAQLFPHCSASSSCSATTPSP